MDFKPLIRLPLVLNSISLSFSSDSLRLSLNAAIVSARLLCLGKAGVEIDGVAVRLLSQCRTLGSNNSEMHRPSPQILSRRTGTRMLLYRTPVLLWTGVKIFHGYHFLLTLSSMHMLLKNSISHLKHTLLPLLGLLPLARI